MRSQMKNAVKNTFVPQHITSDFCIKMWIFLLFFFFPFPYSPGVGQWCASVFLFSLRVVYEICSLGRCPLPTSSLPFHPFFRSG